MREADTQIGRGARYDRVCDGSRMGSRDNLTAWSTSVVTCPICPPGQGLWTRKSGRLEPQRMSFNISSAAWIRRRTACRASRVHDCTVATATAQQVSAKSVAPPIIDDDGEARLS